MMTQERLSVVSIVTNLVVSVPYLIFIFNKYNQEMPTGQDELHFWAAAILLMIPVRIVAEIIIHIATYVLAAISMEVSAEIEKEFDKAVSEHTGAEPKKQKRERFTNQDSVKDERDKLIELKGNRNAYYSFIVGFFIALVAVVNGGTVTTLFSVMILTGMLSELFGLFSQLWFYRRGY